MGGGDGGLLFVLLGSGGDGDLMIDFSRSFFLRGVVIAMVVVSC